MGCAYTGGSLSGAMISSMTHQTSVYLDYNATAPLRPEAREAMLAALGEVGNASSVHGAGRAAKARLEAARRHIAGALGAQARQLVFTSGGTEANALALRLAGHLPVAVSAIEHDSVLAQAPDAVRIPVSRSGVVDVAALAALLTKPMLVSVMAANNESGVLQPIDEIALLVRTSGGLLHVDAAQALGKIDMNGCPADFITVSAHKMGGPQGVGALVIKNDVAPEPLLRGGGQEFGHRAGTENIAAIAGFSAALDATAWQAEAARLRDRLEDMLPAESVLIARNTPRLCNTALLWMPGVAAVTQVMNFDIAGFAVSAGSACSSGKVRQSHVLTAMGYDADVAGESIRVSLGWDTGEADVLAFADVWRAAYARLARKAA
jgi:cysteine desulfurase